MKDSTRHLRDLDERLDLMGEVIVSFFNELDTRKELCSRILGSSPDSCFIF